MAGTRMQIASADGGTFSGYLAVPASGRGPGLILAQEIFGINQHLREVADLYAEEGYVVLAPDLFGHLAAEVELGYEGVDLEMANEYHERFGIEQGVHDLGDALKALRARPECNGKAGVLGFGLGGRLAVLAASRLNIDVAASYYGVGLDEHLDEVGAVRKALAARDDAEIYVYPDAGHGFDNSSRESYNRSAATLAHSRTIGLLRG